VIEEEYIDAVPAEEVLQFELSAANSVRRQDVGQFPGDCF